MKLLENYIRDLFENYYQFDQGEVERQEKIEKIGYNNLLDNKYEAIAESVRFQCVEQLGEYPEPQLVIEDELKEIVTEQEIDDMLNGASDPFG